MKNLIIALSSIVLMSSCTERIDAGHDGILVKLYGSDRGVQDISLVTGRVWYNPFTEDVYEYPTFVRTYDFNPFTVNAKDGSEFTVDPTISIYIHKGSTPKIFKKYRKKLDEVAEGPIYNHIRDAFRIQMNKYTTDEIVSSREKFENDIQIQIGAVLEREGFVLDQLTSGLKYPESIVNAVNAKNKAVQDAMKVENELRISEAWAKKLVVEAEAQKRANELKNQSLTPMLIQQQFIEKWDGKLPVYGQVPTMFKSVQ